MIRSVFITGTDTGVGKTWVSAWIAYHLGAAYWKPIQTGEESDRAWVSQYGIRTYPEAYHFPYPGAPLLAATKMQQRICWETIRCPTDAPLVVEGAGGVLVPLTHRETMRDFMGRLGFPVIVVARTALGTINHILLTLEALAHAEISVLGVICNGPPAPEVSALLKEWGVSILAEIPWLPLPADPRSIPFPASLGKLLEFPYVPAVA